MALSDSTAVFRVNCTLQKLLEAMPSLNSSMCQQFEVWQEDGEYYVPIKAPESTRLFRRTGFVNVSKGEDPGVGPPIEEKVSVFSNIFELVTGMLVNDVYKYHRGTGDQLWSRLNNLAYSKRGAKRKVRE